MTLEEKIKRTHQVIVLDRKEGMPEILWDAYNEYEDWKDVVMNYINDDNIPEITEDTPIKDLLELLLLHMKDAEESYRAYYEGYDPLEKDENGHAVEAKIRFAHKKLILENKEHLPEDFYKVYSDVGNFREVVIAYFEDEEEDIIPATPVEKLIDFMFKEIKEVLQKYALQDVLADLVSKQ